MKIVEITPGANGAHRNQSYHGTIPEGWAVMPDELITANFPFFTIDEIENGTVSRITDGVIPIEIIPAKKRREEAYNIQPVIVWDSANITVTEAAKLWQYYSAEGSDKATQLQSLIATAKQTIRAQYPD